MLDENVLNYCVGLINRYKQEGYKNYLLHTISDNDDYDLCLYLSKDDIVAVNDNVFLLSDLTIQININTTSLNNSIGDVFSRDILFVTSGEKDIDINEVVYTNAKVNYNLLDYTINPDLLVSSSDSSNSNTYSLVIIFLLCSIFLYIFIKSLLRIKN